MTNWWHPRAWWAADFLNDQYGLRSADATLTAVEACTRASIDYGFDASGALVQFAANTARRVTGIGLFAGGQFINRIRNPRGEGGTLGVIGSGGALPAYNALSTANGLSVEFKGAGTESGLPYFDLRFFGTSNATGALEYRLDNSTNATASPGQAWGADCRVKALAGTQPSAQLALYEFNNASYAGTLASGAAATPDATVKRLAASGVAAASTTTNVRAALLMAVSNGTAYDFTIRVYAPKLVQLAVITGSEMITGGAWSFVGGSAWTESGGVLTASAPSATNIARYPAMGLNDQVVRVAYRVATRSAGTVRALAYGASKNAVGASVNATGSYSDYLRVGTAGGANPNSIVFQSSTGDFAGTVDQFSAKIITASFLPDFPILPPAGTPGDATKSADDVKAVASGSEPFAGFAAAGLAGGLSLLLAANLSHAGDGVTRPIADISDDTTGNRLRLYIDTDDRPVAAVVSGGTTLATVKLASALTAGRIIIAVNFDPGGGLYIVRKAGLEDAAAALSAMPTGLKTLRVGSSVMSNYINDTIEQLQVCAPLSQAEARAWVQGIATGAMSATLASVSLAGSGAGRVTGAGAKQLADAAMAGTGNAAAGGALAAVLDSADSLGAGHAAIAGQVAAMLDDARCAAAGALVATGCLAATFDDIEVEASGERGPTWPPVAAALHLTGVRPGPIRLTGRIGERQ